LYVLLAMAAIALLAVAAFGPWTSPRPVRPGTSRPAPRPWLVGLIAFALGFPWCILVLLGYGAAPTVPFGILLVAGVAWVCAVLVLMIRWTRSQAWNGRHRFALVFGGLLACMVGGFVIFAAGGALAIDWIGKAILNVIAVAAMVKLGWQLQQQTPSLETPLPRGEDRWRKGSGPEQA
jgi:hypothetical protein